MRENLVQHETECRRSVIEQDGKLFERLIVETMLFHCSVDCDARLAPFCRMAGESSLWQQDYRPLPPNTRPNAGIVACDEHPFIFPAVVRQGALLTDNNESNVLRVLTTPGIYVPTEKDNVCADAILTLELRQQIGEIKRVAVIIQAKEWFCDVATKTERGVEIEQHVMNSWRWGQRFASDSAVETKFPDSLKCVRSRGVPTARFPNDSDGAAQLPTANPFIASLTAQEQFSPKLYGGNFCYGETAVLFLLVTANNVDLKRYGAGWGAGIAASGPRKVRWGDPTLACDEAVTSLEHMKSWFPSVAHNALAGHKLRKLFGNSR